MSLGLKMPLVINVEGHETVSPLHRLVTIEVHVYSFSSNAHGTMAQVKNPCTAAAVR